MQRRGFLGLLWAAIAAPFVPPLTGGRYARFSADYGGFSTPVRFDRAAIARVFNVPVHMLVSEELLQDTATARRREREALIDWQRNLYLAEDGAFTKGPA